MGTVVSIAAAERKFTATQAEMFAHEVMDVKEGRSFGGTQVLNIYRRSAEEDGGRERYEWRRWAECDQLWREQCLTLSRPAGLT